MADIWRELAPKPLSATDVSQTARRNDIHQYSDAAQSTVTVRENERSRE
jgi:hypothetical protein